MNRKNNQLDLENRKKNVINSLSDCKWIDEPFPEWENFLTLDYWKDWKNKISGFQTEKELDFYTERLSDISYAIRCYKKEGYESPVMMFQYHYSREKHEAMSGMNPKEMVEQEELRLQNISWEDWQNEYKFSPKYLKINELSAEEMLNDSWFNEQVNNLFDLKNGNLPRNKKRKRQKHDPSVFQFSKKTGELNIFAKEVDFNEFYEKKINQYQADIDYDIKEEKIISAFSVYNIFSDKLKKDIALIVQNFGPISDIKVDDVKSIKIIVKDYADYQREEWDKLYEEREERSKEWDKWYEEYKKNEKFKYEGWTEEQLNKEIERLNSFIDKVRNNDESLTQAQRENRSLVIQNLEKELNKAKISLNKVVESNSNTNFQSWSRKKLVAAINLLKAENEELKNNQNLFLTSSSSEREERLRKNQKKLEQFQSALHSLDNNNNQKPFHFLPALETVGVVALLVGLIVYQVKKNKFKK